MAEEKSNRPALVLYNTMSKQKEVFKSKVPNKVGMYVCGVTAYDYSHIGHARAYVAFDVLYRYLMELGYEVTYVRNFTDVDDKGKCCLEPSLRHPYRHNAMPCCRLIVDAWWLGR